MLLDDDPCAVLTTDGRCRVIAEPAWFLTESLADLRRSRGSGWTVELSGPDGESQRFAVDDVVAIEPVREVHGRMARSGR